MLPKPVTSRDIWTSAAHTWVKVSKGISADCICHAGDRGERAQVLEAEDPGVPSCEMGTPASPSKACRAAVGPEAQHTAPGTRLHFPPAVPSPVASVRFVMFLPWSSVSPCQWGPAQTSTGLGSNLLECGVSSTILPWRGGLPSTSCQRSSGLPPLWWSRDPKGRSQSL